MKIVNGALQFRQRIFDRRVASESFEAGADGVGAVEAGYEAAGGVFAADETAIGYLSEVFTNADSPSASFVGELTCPDDG